MDLESLLETALTTHGYQVEQAPPLEGRSGATYPATLIAHQDDTRYLVDASPDPITENDVDALAAIVDDTGIDAALLVALHDDEPPQGASNVHVWPRTRFEAALGRNLLAEALDDDPDPIGPLDEDPIEAPPSPQEHGSQPTPQETPPVQPDTTPQPQPTSAEPSTPPSPSNGTPPQPEPQTSQPQNAPEPATADPTPDQGGQEPATAEPSTDQDTFVSPEEMAKRAQQMLEQGEIPDDGDAEILTDDPQPDTPATAQPSPQPQPDEEPEPSRSTPNPQEATPEPTPAPEEEPMQEGQVFEDADCELLPSKPKDQRDPEPAQQQPETNPPQPEPEPQPQANPQPPTQEATPDQASTTPLAAIAADTDHEQETFLSGGCLEPRISEQQARSEAQGALFNVQDARLELLPFHVFDYRCQLEGDGTTRDAEGRLWVSAQNGAIVQDPDGDLIEDPGIPHERYQPQLKVQAAIHEAKTHLTDALERREELREDYSETAIIERVTLVPKEDTLTLDHQGTAYAPRWRLEGQNGTVFVDALTGDLVAS